LSYLSFDVNLIGSGSVESATLRLFVGRASNDGGSVYVAGNGEVVRSAEPVAAQV
jgi:hypothetical protein